MTDFNYKEYSLENLENWLNDSISSGDATPQEIYDVITKVVRENHDYHKQQSDQSNELLNLLNGQRTLDIDLSDILKEREYYEQSNMTEQELSQYKFSLSCDKDDPSLECQGAWNDFWSDEVKVDGYSVNGMSHSKYWYEYDRNDPNRENPFVDKVVKWQLPVQVDGLTGECFINLPDDLLERAGLKEGDSLEWIDRKDGSFELRKVNGVE
jgi:hypothetical protein